MLLQQHVYKIIQQVPKGKVTTYGDIGKKIGTKAYRAIGQVLHHNPSWPEIPCHRVVMKDGSLAPNYGMGGPSVQKKRLKDESVTFIGNKVDIVKHKVDL
ncbi:MAG: MGMT family protein [Candidatus Roizmanbacteria bacterium]|nr:MGMT family protein [Candidatus Roizmanbacteria bacterium]